MYIVEGNIGVGKSTFLDLIKQLDATIDIIPEPKENWANQQYGQSLLANFYKNPQRWAYTIETLAMVCRAQDHVQEQKNTNPRRVFERSIYSGHYCFALNDYENGYLSDLEWQIYHKWIDFLLKQHCKAPLGFIYLKAEPEVCFERMVKRSRKSELNLSLDYMRNIHNRHAAFLEEKENVFESIKDVPVLILNCNEDFVNSPENMQDHLKKLQSFFTQTHPAQPVHAEPQVSRPANP